ncbi:hypothetical protein LTR56_025094 [Elasticomyces elasticus]|nr:hypothetical protein LTR56_025094 [Elasticomyces elasticus]KAK3663248.1 hypothetical protein LTR22_005906 [Elasticomyces elasticus]
MAACMGFLLRYWCERLNLRPPKIHKLRSGMPRNPSALLNLPAELRNKIWGEALVSKKGPIAINKYTWAQPLLLRTCKQIRKEAGPMYYSLNRFDIVHTDLDFRAHIRFYNIAKKFEKFPKMSYFRGPVGEMSWENLMGGAKAVHEGTVPLDRYAWFTGARAAAAGALRIAWSLRDVEWSTAQKVLDEYQRAVMHVSTGWEWV